MKTRKAKQPKVVVLSELDAQGRYAPLLFIGLLQSSSFKCLLRGDGAVSVRFFCIDLPAHPLFHQLVEAQQATWIGETRGSWQVI